MLPQRSKQLKSHQVVYNAIDLQQSKITVPHLLECESYDKPCDIAPGHVGCICLAAAGAAGQGIKGLPKPQEGDKRGLAHVGKFQKQPFVHYFSANAQHQQQHEVRDKAAG